MIKSQHKINLISVFSISALMRTFLSQHTEPRTEQTMILLNYRTFEEEGIIKEVERIKLLFDMEIMAGGMRTFLIRIEGLVR